MSDEMNRLDEIAARLEATDNGYGAFSAMRPEFDALLAVVREVAGLHRPVPDGLGDTGTGYGTVSPACGTCGTHDEYAVPWPCPTGRALQALTESKERNHEV